MTDHRRTGPRPRVRPIPDATIARLPVYLRVLQQLIEAGLNTVSSERLAEASGVNSPKVRKDLSYLGTYGTRGVGYEVEYLVYQISRELGLTHDWPVALVGLGNLGQALAGYRGFSEKGFRIAALFDKDPKLIGKTIEGLEVCDLDTLPEAISGEDIVIGIIATPATAAQETAERLVAAGVKSILNFAPALLSLPEGVHVRQVDLSLELQILAYHEQKTGTVSEEAG